MFVKTLTGKTITLPYSSDLLVLAVKLMVQANEGIAVEMQRLAFAGKQLDLFRTLCSYSAQRESTLHCVVRCEVRRRRVAPSRES